MSAYALVFHRDGAPAHPGDVASMLGWLEHRADDGRRIECAGPFAFGAAWSWHTCEDVGTAQPLWNARRDLALVFDGRLDNRHDLISALDSTLRSPVPSDPELVMAAYEKWGEPAFGRLLGPMALVMVSLAERAILLVRDALGDRSLFYHERPDVVLVASEERALLAHPAVPGDLDERTMARYYAGQAPQVGATFFAAVRELEPGTGLRFDPSRSLRWTHWQADPDRSISYRCDEEYAEHYRDLLGQAVRARLRAREPVAVQMSGGIDSTSVAAMTAAHEAERGEPVRTVSWVFDSLPECDESKQIDAVNKQLGADSSLIRGDDAWPLRDWNELPLNPSRPDGNAFRCLKTRLYARARQEGIGVLLSGVFGNHLFVGWESHLLDLVRGRSWRHALDAYADAWRHSPHPVRARRRREARTATLRRLVGATIMAMRVGWPAASRARPLPPPWLTPHGRKLLSGEDWPARTPSGRRPDQWFTVLGPTAAASSSGEVFYAAHAGLDLRYPFRDRRLVEFMLAIPANELYNRGVHKYVARLAMNRYLPRDVVWTEGQPTLHRLFARGVDDAGRSDLLELLASKDALWQDYVDADFLSRVLLGSSAHENGDALGVALWNAVAAEIWRTRCLGLSRVAGQMDNLEMVR
jgi:asparagine synthase (glutamine-hydrolysing)